MPQPSRVRPPDSHPTAELDAPSLSLPSPPRRIGRYELLEPLGSGGMGSVYRARQGQLGKLVAVKLLDARVAVRPSGVARFLREARAAAQIRHPHVIEVFDVGIDQGAAYLAMELLDGIDLASLLRERGVLPLAALIELLAPVLAGVRAAHDAGVIHRDLKPSNLFLARRGRSLLEPVVLDFGVSRLLDDEERGLTPLTDAESMVGTAAYVAPEQAKDSRLADDRSDQYSLAVIAYECATGVRPFTGQSLYEVLQSMATARVRPPSELNPLLPQGFDHVLLRALAREPEARFPDLESFAAALLEFAAPRTRQRWSRELLAELGDEKEPLDWLALTTNTPLPLNVPRELARPPVSRLFAFASGALLATAGAYAWPIAGSAHRAAISAPQAAVCPPAPPRPHSVVSQPSAAPVSASVPPARPALATKGASEAPRSSTRDKPLRPRAPMTSSTQRAHVELGVNDAPILE